MSSTPTWRSCSFWWVLGAAVAGGRSAGVVGALLAALSYGFFLTVPYGSFTMERGDDIETTVLLALIGLIAGELVERPGATRPRPCPSA